MDRLSVAILVPVLARPHRVAPLLEAFTETTPAARILFVCDRNDGVERRAIDEAGGQFTICDGGYARKINHAVRSTDEPYVAFAADDLAPHAGWLEKALAVIADGAQVVGLNDLIPRPHRPDDATHFLLTREAAELPCLDGSRGPLHEGYAHNFPDRELIETAKKRGSYAYAEDAVIEHLHPLVGKAERDAVHEKGDATFRHDARRFRRRAHLWT